MSITTTPTRRNSFPQIHQPYQPIHQPVAENSENSIVQPIAGNPVLDQPRSISHARRGSCPNIVISRIIAAPPQLPRVLSCSEKVSNCFQRIKEWFDNSWIGKLYYRYDPYRPFGMYAYNFLSNTYNISTFNSIFNINLLSNALRKDWRECSWLEKFKHVGKILFILSIPFALYGLGMAMREFVNSNNRLGCVLRMGENLSWLGSSAGTLACGLFTVGMGTINALIWAFAFYTAGAFLGISTTILNGIDLKKRLSFRSEIETLFPTEIVSKSIDPSKIKKLSREEQLDQLRKKSKLEINKSKAKDCWKVLKGKTTEYLAELLNVPIEIATSFKRSEFLDENFDKRLEAIHRLKDRMNQQVFFGKIAVVSSVIAFIGTLILLFTPLFPVAYGLLALSGALSMMRFYYNHKHLKDFTIKTQIGIKLPGM